MIIANCFLCYGHLFVYWIFARGMSVAACFAFDCFSDACHYHLAAMSESSALEATSGRHRQPAFGGSWLASIEADKKSKSTFRCDEPWAAALSARNALGDRGIQTFSFRSRRRNPFR